MRKRVRWISFFCAAGVLAGALYFLWRNTKEALDGARRENFLCASAQLWQGARALCTQLSKFGAAEREESANTAQIRTELARCRGAAAMLARDLSREDALGDTEQLFSYFSVVEQTVFSTPQSARTDAAQEERLRLLQECAGKIALAMEQLSLTYFEKIPLHGTAAEYRAAAKAALQALAKQLSVPQNAASLPLGLAVFSTLQGNKISCAEARRFAAEYIGQAAALLGKEGAFSQNRRQGAAKSKAGAKQSGATDSAGQNYCFYCKNYSVGISGADGSLLDLQAQLAADEKPRSAQQLRQRAQSFAEKYESEAVFSSEAYFEPLYYARFLLPQGALYVVLDGSGKTVGYFGTNEPQPR